MEYNITTIVLSSSGNIPPHLSEEIYKIRNNIKKRNKKKVKKRITGTSDFD